MDIKKLLPFFLAALVTAISLVGALLIFLNNRINTTEQPAPPAQETCVEGVFMAWNPDWGGFMVLGDTELCGVDLKWGDMHGPSTLVDPIEKLIEGG